MPNVIEKYIAKVVANNDSEFRGRIKVTCADLTGDPEAVLPGWIEPLLDWGWFYVPDVDEHVEIEGVVSTDDDEVPGQSMIMNPQITWRGKRFYHEAEEAPTPVHDDFKQETTYGKRRGFATPNGHILMFDDTDGAQQVRLTWHAKEDNEDKYSYIAFDADGSVVMQNKTGSLVYIDAKNGAITIVDENGNLIASDEVGLRLIDKHGNIIDMKQGAIQILGQKAVTVSCKNCDLKAGSVNLGDGADQPIIRGTEWYAWAETHIHTSGGSGSPSSPPTVTPPPTSLSTVVKTK